MNFSFEKLEVWQRAEDLAVEVYTLLPKFPVCEQYAMCDQIRRSVTSISFNIAEGSGRPSYKEKIRFIEISFGSLRETYSQLHLAVRLGYIDQETDFNRLLPSFYNLEKKLNGLKWFYQNQINNGQAEETNNHNNQNNRNNQ